MINTIKAPAVKYIQTYMYQDNYYIYKIWRENSQKHHSVYCSNIGRENDRESVTVQFLIYQILTYIKTK